MMDAETRAVLREITRKIRQVAIGIDGALGTEDRTARMWVLKLERSATRLRALLDEKGGDASESAIDSRSAAGLPVAGVASTAPPDSLAKIAEEEAMTDAKDPLEELKALEMELAYCAEHGEQGAAERVVTVHNAQRAWEKERTNAQFASDTLDKVVKEHAALRAAVEKVRDKLKEHASTGELIGPGWLDYQADALDAALRGQP